VLLAIFSLLALFILCLRGLHYVDDNRRKLGCVFIGLGWLIGTCAFLLLALTGFSWSWSWWL
jgi:hypothetical protein